MSKLMLVYESYSTHLNICIDAACTMTGLPQYPRELLFHCILSKCLTFWGYRQRFIISSRNVISYVHLYYFVHMHSGSQCNQCNQCRLYTTVKWTSIYKGISVLIHALFLYNTINQNKCKHNIYYIMPAGFFEREPLKATAWWCMHPVHLCKRSACSLMCSVLWAVWKAKNRKEQNELGQYMDVNASAWTHR